MTPKKIRNFTAREVVLFVNGQQKKYPSEGQARVEVNHTKEGTIEGADVIAPVYGNVTGLPPEQPDTWIIVSRMVAEELPDRYDLIWPERTIRDDSGRVVGCRAWGRMPVDN